MFSRYGLSVTKHAFIFLTLLSSSGFNYAHGADFNAVLTPYEQKIDGYRNAEIKQLQLVLTRSSSREQQPDLLLRLAELYTEKYRLFFLKENELWSKKMEAYLALPLERQKYSKKPVLDNSTSRGWLGKAVSVLERIPLQKARYSRIDEVYYFLGFNKWELGKKKEGAANFENIIRSHPDSKFAPEAYRYVADFAFADRNFSKAKDLYKKAAQFENSPARAKVLYGLAWSQFKMKEYKNAVNSMRSAIELGKAAGSDKPGLALQRDAAESLALFYSEGGNVDEAVGFFTDLFGEQEGAQILRKLAESYQAQGKYSKALAVNKQIIAMGGAAAREGDQQRFEIMVDSLKIASTRGDRAREAALLKSMTAEYVTNAKEVSEDKIAAIQAQVRKSATLAHKEGNKSKNPKEAFQRAEDMYRLYLAAFANRIKLDDQAEINFYLADVLAQLGRHKDAAAQYGKMVELAQNGEGAYKKYQKDAASGVVYSLDNYFKGKGSGKSLSKADGDQVISAIDAYVRLYPNDKDTTKYLARVAGILVTSGRMAEAKPRLMDIIEKYSGNQEAWDAAATLLKDAEDKKDYEEASRLAKLFLENQGLLAQDKKGEFKKRLESIASRAEFQQVRKVEENKDFGEAARGYEKLAGNSKDSEVRHKALNNAAVSFSRAGDRENEMRVYKKILDLYPGNEAAEKSILGIGNENFLSGKYEDAAEIYELFYGIYENKLGTVKAPSQKAALESLRSAALLRTALKQSDKAAENFKKIVEAANKGIGSARDAAGEFLFDTAKRYRDEGNTAEAVRSFQKYASSFADGPHAVGSNLEIALLYEKLREEEKAQNYFRNTISKAKAKGKASAEDLSYGARARIELLRPAEEAFEKAELRLPEKQLKADINAKLAALDRLNKGYIEVMDFGDGTWGVEAYRRMAMAYRNFGQKLEAAPIPQEYSAEDKAKFKAQLKNVAAPVYVKVGETLDTALQKGENLGVVGPVMARVYLMSVLTSARPDRLPLVQTINWDRPADWIMGETLSSDSDLEQKRKILRTKPDDLSAWVAIGNRHLLRGEEKLAEIFYLHALDKNPKYGPAINNLAYLKGKEGDLAKALSGFKTALNNDEFALVPKKNIARMHMASGLWRHASLAFRQLEVRTPNDKEVKRGLALSNLAMGKTVDSSLISQGDGDNGKFAEAILALAKGDRNKAANMMENLSDGNEFAQLILTFWNTKESK